MSQAGLERPRAGLSDMLRSLAVLLIPVLAFVGYQTLLRDEPDPIPPVDYAGAAASARDDGALAVLTPAALPAGWRATSVRYTPGPHAHWHLGVLTDDDEYVGLEQVVDDAEDAAATFAPDTVAAGSVTVAGLRWLLRTSSDDETALVRSDGDVSTVVIGTVPRDVLVSYVETLRS